MGRDYDPFNPQVNTSTSLQAAIALALGVSAFLVFCVLRVRYPKIYVANFTQFNSGYRHVLSRRKLPRMPATMFGWLPVLFRISEEEVMANAGLDAVVFLCFFKFAIKTIGVCLVLAYTIILPIRYHYTGRFDDERSEEPEGSLRWLEWLYTGFTYVVTSLVTYFLFKSTTRIIDMRQRCLGAQDSVTDRTVKLQGIPPIMREEQALRQQIDSLNIGKIDSVLIVREWHDLNALVRLRRRLLRQAERWWVEYLRHGGVRSKSDLLSTLEVERGDSVRMAFHDVESTGSNLSPPSLLDQISEFVEDAPAARPKTRTSLLGPRVDAINYALDQLRVVDAEIALARQVHYPASSTAFITMESVAQAQLLAQAVLDPKVDHLITSLAPAPHDIIWDNLCLTRRERNWRGAFVSALIGITSLVVSFLVVYLTKFLKVQSISKISPRLADLIKAHPWAETAITRILPPYVFTLFNVVVPYLFIYITSMQGYTSHADEELSSVAKNFFYNFVNLFLIFTLFGTVSLTDTGLIAKKLAEKLQELSVFYIHLTILLAVGLFPYKLLLVGNLLQHCLSGLLCKTPRDYLRMYHPPVFNFGLQLPTPMLIFIITILYSVMNSKILTSGLVYFVVGFYVYKYQLLYACVHPPHSTGKVWPMITRRIIVGLLLFQLTMAGVLGLRRSYVCATAMAPLPIYTLYCLWLFERSYVPLSVFIALRAIDPGMANEETLDERREHADKYEFPNLVSELDGPLIAVDTDEVLVVQNDGCVVKRMR
ncbi:calcium permeable stress-gated cation channel 1 [Diutina catenulata]